jgi:hypothetical protein
LAIVIFLINHKCDGGGNPYYSECSHSRLPRYLTARRVFNRRSIDLSSQQNRDQF